MTEHETTLKNAVVDVIFSHANNKLSKYHIKNIVDIAVDNQFICSTLFAIAVSMAQGRVEAVQQELKK